MNSHLSATPLPEPIGGRDEDTVERGHGAHNLTAPALLEAVDAVEGIALGLCLQRSQSRLIRGSRFERELIPTTGVGNAPQIPPDRAALPGPLDRVPLQKVRRTMLEPRSIGAGSQIRAVLAPREDERRPD